MQSRDAAPQAVPPLDVDQCNALRHGIVILDRDPPSWCVTWANEAYLRGVPESDRVVGSPIEAYLPARSAAEARAVLETAAREGSASATGQHVIWPAIGSRWYRWSVARDPHDHDRMIAIVADVTRDARRIADAELDRGILVEVLRDAVIRLDAHGRVRWANPAAERLFGVDMVGAPWSAVTRATRFDPLAWAGPAQAVDQALAGERPEASTVVMAGPDGERFLHAVVEPVNEREGVRGAVLSLRDMTVEHRLRTQIRDLIAREADGHATLRRSLADGLHDTVLQSLAELSLRLEAGGDAASTPNLLEVIQRASTEARAIQAELRTPTSDVPLSEQITELLDQWRGQGLADVRLEGDPLPRLAPWREEVLAMVVTEALHNALKHASGAPVRIKAAVDDEAVRISVSDDGPGSTSEERSRAADGGHIGIRLSRERMAAIDGTYALRSAPGEGTTVSLTVPR